MSVSAQSSTPVQLNEELIIVAARTIDIDTVWVVGVACVQKRICKKQLYSVILQHVFAQKTPSGRRLQVLLAGGPTQGNVCVCVCVITDNIWWCPMEKQCTLQYFTAHQSAIKTTTNNMLKLTDRPLSVQILLKSLYRICRPMCHSIYLLQYLHNDVS